MLLFNTCRSTSRLGTKVYLGVITFLLTSLVFNAQAQPCGAACGNDDEVQVEFYGASAVFSNQGTLKTTMGLNGVFVSSGVSQGPSQAITPKGTAYLKENVVYSALLTFDQNFTNYCQMPTTAYFQMIDGCGKVLQLWINGSWVEASSYTTTDWWLVDLTVGVRVVSKATLGEGASNTTNPPTNGGGANSRSALSAGKMVSLGSATVQVNPATFGSILPIGSTPQSAGFNTGSLSITGAITPSLGSLTNLKIADPGDSSLNIIREAGAIRQVKNSIRLADIQNIGSGGFEVRFFEQGTFGHSAVANLYPINSGAIPSSIVTYTPVPAQAGDHLGGIRVTTASPGQPSAVTETLSTSTVGDSWRVIQSSGGFETETQDFFSAFLQEPDGLHRTDLIEVRRNGVITSKSIRTYLLQSRSEGNPAVVVESHEFLLSETVFDSANTSQTTMWEPVPSILGRVKSVTRPDGSWEVYSYYTGTESIANGDPVEAYPTWVGLLKQTLKPNNGLPANPSLATAANSISTWIVYGTPSSTPGGGFGSEQSRRTTFLPGGVIKIDDWEKTPAVGNLSNLIAALGDAGISPAWLPLQANVRSEADTQYSSAFEGISATSYSYRGSHVAGSTWDGNSFGSLDAEGNGSVTGYQHGIYDFGSGVFTPNDPAGNQAAWGMDVRSTTVKVVAYGASPALGEATRETSINDRFGKPLRTELAIKTDSGVWSLATATTYEYPAYWPDGRVKETIMRQDGRIISRTLNEVSGVDSLTTVWGEQGTETRTLTDPAGRTKSVTQKGIPAQDGHQAQSDRVTSYTYSGQTTTVVTTANGLSRTQVSVVDLTGRTVSETDPSGATTLTSYPNAGRDTLTTLPGGLTRLVTNDLNGRNVSVTGSAVVDEYYSYTYSMTGAALGNLITTKRIGDLANSPRYQSSEQDWAGRAVNTKSPSPTGVPSEIVTTVSAYQPNTRRLIAAQSASGQMLFQKPAANSETTYSGYDLNNSLALEPASTDRVTESSRNYVFEEGYWWQVATQKTYDVDGSAASAITSISKRCLHGMPGGFAAKSVSISPGGEITTMTTSIDQVKKIVTQTETSSAATENAVAVTVNGLLVSRKGHDAVTSARWEYDGLGQVLKEVTPRGASNGKTYNADGSLQTATDFAGKTTTFAYYGPTHPAAGKISQMTNPLGKTTTYLYTDLGQVIQEAGTAGYKVTYEYDEYGSKKKMFTWRDGVTFDPTEWIYQAATGVLDSKKDAAGKSVSYTYHPTGKIHVRTWARTPLVTTTYNYQAPGDLTGIDYSDATPDVVLTGLDRLGRPTAITQTGIGTENLSYHSGKGTENARFYSTGHSLLPSIGLRTSAPDPAGRPAGFEETSGANTAVVRGVIYGYDTAGRFETVSDGANSYVYSYQPNSSLVSTMESRTGGNSWFKESRYFDIPGRLIGIRSDRTNGSLVVAQISTHGYKLDALGRRTRNTFYDGSYWEYGYNDRSEVTSATRKTPAGIVIPQLAASYDYDGIGNRLSSTSPILGNHTYIPSSLNQYASITTSNSRTAIGRAPAAWNVEVDGVAASRTGELYHRAITASNGVSPVWKDVVTRRDTGTPSTTGHFWYAATPLSPVHDSDGNLTNDGRWSYVWSAENRLIQIESTLQATLAGHPYTKVVNAYDWQGRRIAKHVWQGGTAASPIFSSSTRWLYNGWNEIAEFSASSSTATTLTREKTFTWGLDLSGSLQGAGGVGGLLVQTTVASGVKEGASYDGNGNIVAWTNSMASAPTARREYDAFGNTVVNEGVWPSSFGFSTKFQDTETGLYYYGYRFYDPVMGRWVSKDPIEEKGGLNLYGFLENFALGGNDVLGLEPWRVGARSTSAWAFVPSLSDWSRDWTDHVLYRSAMARSNGAAIISPPASALSKHYLNATGSPYQLPFGHVIELESNLKKSLAKDLIDSARFATSLASDSLISSHQWTDFGLESLYWFPAMGTIRWTGQGYVKKKGSSNELTIEYHFWDPYDFDEHGTGSAGPGMQDWQWHRLARVGLAKEFLVSGESARITLKWCGTLAFPEISTGNLDFLNGSFLEEHGNDKFVPSN